MSNSQRKLLKSAENHNEHVNLNSNNKSLSEDDQDFDPGVSYHSTKWTLGQKIHLCVTLTLLLVCIIFIVVYIHKIDHIKTRARNKSILKTKANNSKDICDSPECILLAAQVLTYIDNKVDPCKDFYRYACGGWERKNFIPDNKPLWDIFSELLDANDKLLKKVLEEGKANTSNGAISKLFTLYKSCKNEAAVESVGVKPLLNLIEAFGSWKIGNSTWSSKNWNMLARLVDIHRMFPPSMYGPTTSPLFETKVLVDKKNSSRHIVQISQPEFGMWSRNFFLANNSNAFRVKAAYSKAAVRLAIMLGGGPTTKKLMDDVIAFETKLANASVPPDILRDVRTSYKKISIRELANATGGTFNWLYYLSENMKETGAAVKSSMIISTKPLKYLIGMVKAVKETSKETLANYFIWTIVRGFVKFLPRKFTKAYFEFEKTMNGVQTEDPRWQQCIRTAEEIMGMAMGSLFVKEKFKAESKDMVEKMIQNIKETFVDNLSEIDWMDKKTKKEAETKAKAMIGNIGYPSFLMDSEKLSALYSGVNLKASEYFANIAKLRKSIRLRNLKKITTKVDREEWTFPPSLVNAFYDPGRNKMVFLAGILQPPFYSWKGPMSMNYGGIGMVMGHELTHGFDDQGRLYDQNGDMSNWWTGISTKNFMHKASCIAKQYSKYSLYGVHVNGNLTLGENIADNGGLKTSFKAYQKWLKEYGRERKLPGVNMTNEQLFFLASAQIWCSLDRKENILVNLMSEPHSPGIFRVIGTLSNSDEFSKAFSCPKDTRMNPINKCNVW